MSTPFVAAVLAGAEAARAGGLVTFGITPERAETGFGYLALDEAPVPGRAQPVASFVEKPDLARAEEMVAGGRHLWNGGIFLFRVADILAAFETHAAAMIAPCEAALRHAERDLGFIRLGADYGRATAQSIDYAIMEKAGHIVTVPVTAGWSDLGSWAAVHGHGSGRLGRQRHRRGPRRPSTAPAATSEARTAISTSWASVSRT